MTNYFFCGIGGIGMSSIALYLARQGNAVAGSDRSFDAGHNGEMRRTLARAGIALFPQDGRGVRPDTDVFVVSSAVEDSIPDVRRAKDLRIPIRRRAQVLAGILHDYSGIAIAGTSGKTTITAMVGHILYKNALDPTMINGGISNNAYHREKPSNLIFGHGRHCVIEADESDGSIDLYTPDYAVVSNISLDHKPLDEIRPLFASFLSRAKRGAVVNADCPETRRLRLDRPNVISFSAAGDKRATLRAENIRQMPGGIRFDLNGMPVRLPLVGAYNVANALAAVGAGLLAGIPVADSVRALKTFRGTRRRMQAIGAARRIAVIDDYAHNPEKIKAALTALQSFPGAVFVIFQPHGFAPTRLMKDELIRTLHETLGPRTTFIMPDIYYAGGTVAQDISSRDIVDPLVRKGCRAHYIPTRAEIIAFLMPRVKPGARIVVMGARDDTLTDFAKDILNHIKKGKP
ncbi:MAG: Mur ligase family protein [Alphaproteobacteria bacterium]|nr:Mur ligase family protein [Alphaproteobacteria bacterium]